MSSAVIAATRPGRVFFYFSTAPGMKALVAVTGAAMFLFLLVHLSGNLLVFAGPEKMDHYSQFLHSMPSVLWLFRLGLLASILVHIWVTVALTKATREARPIQYQVKKYFASSYASRTMTLSGPWIAGFVILHIAHFTTGNLHGRFQHLKPYENAVFSFHSPFVSAAYIGTMCLIGLHLTHGLWSMFQSLGWNHPRFDKAIRGSAVSFSTVLTAGFCSVPVAILAGWVQ